MAALDFRGQTVWVTGAGKGIGYATALAFVEAGANVTGFDLAFDGESYPFATETLDVADADQVREACSRLLANTERLDVLVNAAGILRMGATDQLSAEDWQQTFAVNVGGAFNLFQQTMAHIWLELRGKDDCIYPLAGRVCGPLSSKRLLAGSAVNQSDHPSRGKRRRGDYRWRAAD